MLKPHYKSILISLTFALCQSQAFAQDIDAKPAQFIQISDTLTLEITPPEFTVEHAEDPYENEWGYVIIPAAYETEEKIVTLAPAVNLIEMTLAQYSKTGALLSKPQANVKTVPPVTQTLKIRRQIKPPRAVKRKIPSTYHPPLIKTLTKPEAYIIRNPSGETLRSFDSPNDLIEFMKGLE